MTPEEKLAAVAAEIGGGGWYLDEDGGAISTGCGDGVEFTLDQLERLGVDELIAVSEGEVL